MSKYQATRRKRKTALTKPKMMNKTAVPVKAIVKSEKTDNRQLRNDLTKIFVLTMLAVGLEVALKLLWR